MKEKQFRIIDLVKLVDWKYVDEALGYFYPKFKNKLKPVFEYLKTVKSKRQKDPGERIQVICGGFWLYENEDKFFDKDWSYSIATNKYSLSFCKWAEAANILIESETLKRNLPEEIVAHFLWEITYYGNEKDAAKKYKELKGRVADIKKNPKRFRKLKTRT